MTASLRQLADRLGLGAEVEIGGAVPMSRLGEHYAGLDLFLLPSRSEAFALTVGEALACGVPTVVTTAAPWGEVEERGCGWSVTPTVAGIAAALARASGVRLALPTPQSHSQDIHHGQPRKIHLGRPAAARRAAQR
jgi:glycosyltransferase involved in cell wall biosynthesis